MTEQERASILLDRLFQPLRTCRYGLTTTYLQNYAIRHGLERDALVAEATKRVMHGQYKVFRRMNKQTVFRPNAYHVGRFTGRTPQERIKDSRG